MNVMCVDAHLGEPQRFYIDCPLDVEMIGPELRRIEIPRELARYITDLQQSNRQLGSENAELQAKLDGRTR